MARRFWRSDKEWRAYRAKARVERRWARRKAIREGKAKTGDKTHVHHRDSNPFNRSNKNLQVMPAKKHGHVPHPKRTGAKSGIAVGLRRHWAAIKREERRGKGKRG